MSKIYFCKISIPECILLVVLKNCDPELSNILAELFNMCLRQSCFGRSCKWSLYLIVLEKGLQLNPC